MTDYTIAFLLRQVVLSLGALTDEVLSLVVSLLGQPEGPCHVTSGCVSAHTAFKAL